MLLALPVAVVSERQGDHGRNLKCSEKPPAHLVNLLPFTSPGVRITIVE
jgi:hypothetical protein